MSFNMSAGISALRAHGTRMSVISHNVANCSTEEFKKSRALLKEGPAGTVGVDISTVESPGPVVYERSGSGKVMREMSNVDLGEEITRTIPCELGYTANLEIIRTEDEMQGVLLDLLA
ncbi:MAG: flagellar basal body rod C-terminal domain-containing protein [Desulfobacteraceae bacterium]